MFSKNELAFYGLGLKTSPRIHEQFAQRRSSLANTPRRMSAPSVRKRRAVWTFGDVALGLMTFPNLIALLALTGFTAKLTRDYFSREHKPLR